MPPTVKAVPFADIAPPKPEDLLEKEVLSKASSSSSGMIDFSDWPPLFFDAMVFSMDSMNI